MTIVLFLAILLCLHVYMLLFSLPTNFCFYSVHSVHIRVTLRKHK